MLPFEEEDGKIASTWMVAGVMGFMPFVSLRSKARSETDGQTRISVEFWVKLCFARLDLNFDFPTTLHLRWTSSNEAWTHENTVQYVPTVYFLACQLPSGGNFTQ
eukprot:scaffold5169_cov109-Skeletonema_dohrnii-CCMP3373.AAC.2